MFEGREGNLCVSVGDASVEVGENMNVTGVEERSEFEKYRFIDGIREINLKEDMRALFIGINVAVVAPISPQLPPVLLC